MILVFDTETTSRRPREARIVQLAAALLHPVTLSAVEKLDVLVRPFGFDIPDEATAIHGITNDDAHENGIDLAEALNHFDRLVGQATRLVAHNLSYDNTVAICEYARLSRDVTELVGLQPLCTMFALTDRCKLPGRLGNYKWPTLDEAYRFCFNHEPLYPLHNAAGDVAATADIFRHGVKSKWW